MSEEGIDTEDATTLPRGFEELPVMEKVESGKRYVLKCTHMYSNWVLRDKIQGKVKKSNQKQDLFFCFALRTSYF
jgi:hypothetical protein